MKKFAKIFGIIAGTLLLIIVALGLYFKNRSQTAVHKTYAVNVRPVAIPTDATSIAHGQHIAQTRGCIDCHGRDFAGAKVIEDGAMGRLYGSNITKGKGSSTATFKDDDWVRAIRHGVGADGRGLFIMPSEEYSKLTDEDLGALIAFLKTVPAVDRERVPTAYGPISQILLTTAPHKMIAAEGLDHARLAPPMAIVKAPTAEYGRYLAAGCTGCHGANYSGGKIEIGPPNWPMAANLTPHPESRLSKWAEQDFINTIRTMKRPDGTAVDPVMPRGFSGMDDVELKALWAFFRTLPPAAQGVR
jgi:cytochrome c553